MFSGRLEVPGYEDSAAVAVILLASQRDPGAVGDGGRAGYVAIQLGQADYRQDFAAHRRNSLLGELSTLSASFRLHCTFIHTMCSRTSTYLWFT
jgi:hypothetical protein